MTMYFVKTPTANQILRTCYFTLAILTVMAVSGGRLAGGDSSAARPARPAADTQARSGPTVGGAGGPRESAPPRPSPPEAPTSADTENLNNNNNNYNNNNIDNNNNKLIINPNAGAKSLDDREGDAEAAEGPAGARRDAARESRAARSIQDEHGATLRKETLHKLMSEKDLRRTFQVETHDQVPEYQVLKLTVSHDGSHLISPISDLGELLIPTTNQQHRSDDGQASASSYRDQPREDRPRQTQERATRVKRSAGRQRQRTQNEQADAAPKPADQQQDERLIVMNLSTFGQDFSLRLKRNADFQQRIKDMKMFLAESTSDGSLRYTEIKNPNAHQHHKQEPHKRAASSDAAELLENSPAPQQVAAPNSTAKPPDSKPSKQSDWNIGSTYHDEENLAALLIERDRLTGQIKVDGTIGNDFVIKPMPRATVEALAAKQRLAAAKTPAEDASASESANSARSSQPERASESAANELKQAAGHLHDDDPHDDDEMFLDEDEALELANLNQTAQAAKSFTNSTAAAPTLPQQQQQQHQQQHSARALSKAASERKWRKYRKLMAQTQVPKLGAPEPQRKRRHAAATDVDSEGGEGAGSAAGSSPQHFRISHHIVYRQKPSSEGSSAEHQHSFMLAPGQQSMEEMVRRFPAKRSTSDNSLGTASSRLTRDELATPEADFAHDPLGGQFYLEPASLTGFERAGHADWSFGFSARRPALAAPPPYALNNTDASLFANASAPAPTTTTARQQQHARFKRHAHGRARNTTGSRQAPHRAGPHAAASNRRHKRQAPDVVWPEVLLVVDYDSFLLHGGDSREVKRYFVSFWNGVDLRYKLLVNPHIRISLAGMIVAKDRDATPYLERNRLRAPNADAVDAAGALTDMGKYLYREDRLPTYDLAVVITKLDMCRRRYEGGRCNRGTAGFAYVGGACVVNKRLEKVNSVAIIEDSGGFSGIIVAAHEVGHLLGCVHDGSPPPSYLGGPGATHCPWEDGFIMSDLRHTERGFRWSQCSVEQFKHFLNGETATCLYNYPHESQMLHRLLPGSMLSLDDQCKRDRGTNACFKDARVCAQLFCFDSASGYCVSYRPAAEGSPCGDGHVCRNGKCVGEIENIIPDYTHQSQTVVAAAGGRQRSLTAAGSSPGVAAAAVSGALVPPPPRLADNGLSASSTSTATSSPDSAGSTSAKLVANERPATGSQMSSRRMDTVPVDTPLSLARAGHLYQPIASQRNADEQADSIQPSLPINYHHHHQAPLATTQHHSNLNSNSNYKRQTTSAAAAHKPLAQYPTTASAAAMKKLAAGHQHQEQQVAARQLQQLQAAAYADPYAYSSQRRRDPTTASALMTSPNELYASTSSSSSARLSPFQAQPGAKSHRRAYRQRPEASPLHYAAPAVY